MTQLLVLPELASAPESSLPVDLETLLAKLGEHNAVSPARRYLSRRFPESSPVQGFSRETRQRIFKTQRLPLWRSAPWNPNASLMLQLARQSRDDITRRHASSCCRSRFCCSLPAVAPLPLRRLGRFLPHPFCSGAADLIRLQGYSHDHEALAHRLHNVPSFSVKAHLI